MKRLLLGLLLLAAIPVRAAVICDSGVCVKINPTTRAMQVELFDGAGNSLIPNELARGLAAANVRQSAATAAGATVWAIHNPSSTRTVMVKACQLQLIFDGAGAATLMKYELIKATGVTTFSGGSVVTPLVKKTSLGSPSAVARVLDTGLTTTGAVFGGQGAIMSMNRVTPSATQSAPGINFVVEFRSLQSGEIELAQNEMLAIRNLATSVIGDNILGYCEFSEK